MLRTPIGLLTSVVAAVLLSACATGRAVDPPASEETAPLEEPAASAGSQGTAPASAPVEPSSGGRAGETSPRAAILGEEFSLPVGESVTLPEIGATLGFVKVLSESRCPRDVLCVWAGMVVVEMEWCVGGGEPERFSIGDFPPMSRTMSTGHVLTVVDVVPYPDSKRRTKPEEYVATVKVAAGGADAAGQGQGEGEGNRSARSESRP